MVAHGGRAPIVVARLMAGPLLEHEVGIVDARLPHLLPRIADHRGVGRLRQPPPHLRRPAEIVEHHGAAHVVDVVVVAVVGAVADDDGFQRRRAVLARRHHQRVDGAPRLAHHADIAVARRMPGDLVDHLDAGEQLLLAILVGEHAFRIAGARQVDAEAEIVVIGEPRIHLGVADHGAVAPPIRIELDDRRAFGAGFCGFGVVPEMASEPDRRLPRKRHVEEYVLGVGDLVAHFERRTVGLRGPRVEQAEPRQSERKRQGSAELERLAAREIWQTGRGRGRSSLGESEADYATLPWTLASPFASASTSSSVNTRLRVRKRTPSGRFQREARAAPRHHVDDQLGVLPIIELVGIHEHVAAADRAEMHVVAADAELAFRVAHRRRAVAAAARLMEHQRPVFRPQLVDKGQSWGVASTLSTI